MLCLITSFRKSCRLWGNVEKYNVARQAAYDDIIRSMRFACWINKATNTHSEYVIIISFPLQQWLQERVSALRHTTLLFLLTTYDVMEKNNKKITWLHIFFFVLGPDFNGKENFLWSHSLYGLRPQSHIKNRTKKFRLQERCLSSG